MLRQASVSLSARAWRRERQLEGAEPQELPDRTVVSWQLPSLYLYYLVIRTFGALGPSTLTRFEIRVGGGEGGTERVKVCAAPSACGYRWR